MSKEDQEDSIVDLGTYQKRLQIDKNQLDEELVNQPDLYWKVADEHVKAVSYRDAARQEVKTIEAELYNMYRKAANEERERLTEDGMKAKIASSSEYQTAYQDYLGWKTIAELWEGLKESCSQRNYVLRDLVSLHVAGYYGNQSATGLRYEVANRVAERVREEQTIHRNQKRVSSKDEDLR